MHGKSNHIYLDPENAHLKHTGTACTVQFATPACKNTMKLRTQLHQTARPEPLHYDLRRPLAKHTGALRHKLTAAAFETRSRHQSCRIEFLKRFLQ